MKIWTFQGHMGFTYKLQVAITQDYEGSPRIPHVTILGPDPNFPLFSTILFRALSHSPLTRSLTRRSDRHQIT